MSDNRDDDVIIFDPFDDDGYARWHEAIKKSNETDSAPVSETVSMISETDSAPADEKVSEPADPDQAVPEQAVPGGEPASEEKKGNRFGIVFELAIYVVLVILCVELIPRYVMERVNVDGSSMNDTLHDQDMLIGEKLSVEFDRLKRYDIIYFYPQGNMAMEPYIKRIIGLPGDTVYISDSVVYVNGSPLHEDFAAEDRFKAYDAADPVRLGEDEYFVLGDNRNHSTDSRFSTVGVVNRKDIEGRAVFRLWPLSSFGKID